MLLNIIRARTHTHTLTRRQYFIDATTCRKWALDLKASIEKVHPGNQYIISQMEKRKTVWTTSTLLHVFEVASKNTESLLTTMMKTTPKLCDIFFFFYEILVFKFVSTFFLRSFGRSFLFIYSFWNWFAIVEPSKLDFESVANLRDFLYCCNLLINSHPSILYTSLSMCAVCMWLRKRLNEISIFRMWLLIVSNWCDSTLFLCDVWDFNSQQRNR